MMLNADVRKGEGVDQMRTPADVLYGRPHIVIFEW